MKHKKIIRILLLVSIIIAASGYYYFIKIPTKRISERCIQYDPKWENLEDCYGLISIRYGWDIDYYYLLDHVHDYEVARIYGLDQFVYQNGKILVINRQAVEEGETDGVKAKYRQKTFQNGQLTESSYDDISEIPTYLAIDTVSGEVEAYVSAGDAPAEYRPYFSELEAR